MYTPSQHDARSNWFGVSWKGEGVGLDQVGLEHWKSRHYKVRRLVSSQLCQNRQKWPT